MRHKLENLPTLITAWNKQKYLNFLFFWVKFLPLAGDRFLVLTFSQHVIAKNILIHEVQCPKSVITEGREKYKCLPLKYMFLCQCNGYKGQRDWRTDCWLQVQWLVRGRAKWETGTCTSWEGVWRKSYRNEGRKMRRQDTLQKAEGQESKRKQSKYR